MSTLSSILQRIGTEAVVFQNVHKLFDEQIASNKNWALGTDL